MADCYYLECCQDDLSNEIILPNKTFTKNPLIIKNDIQGNIEWGKWYIRDFNIDGEHNGCSSYITNIFKKESSTNPNLLTCDEIIINNNYYSKDLIGHAWTGVSKNINENRNEMQVIGINTDGDIINALNFDRASYGECIESTKDYGLIAIGRSYHPITFIGSTIFAKLSNDVQIDNNFHTNNQADLIYYNDKNLLGYYIIENYNGTCYYLVGNIYEDFDNSDIFIMKILNETDIYPHISWIKRFDYNNQNDKVDEVIGSNKMLEDYDSQLNDYVYYITGRSNIDGLVFKIDKNGNVLNAKLIGNPDGNERIGSINQNLKNSLDILINQNAPDKVTIMRLDKNIFYDNNYQGVPINQYSYGNELDQSNHSKNINSFGMDGFYSAFETYSYYNAKTMLLIGDDINNFVCKQQENYYVQSINLNLPQISLPDYTNVGWYNTDISIREANFIDSVVCTQDICYCDDIPILKENNWTVKFEINQVIPSPQPGYCCYDVEINDNPEGTYPPNCMLGGVDIIITETGQLVNNERITDFGQNNETGDFCIPESSNVHIHIRYYDIYGRVVCEQPAWLSCNGIIPEDDYELCCLNMFVFLTSYLNQ